MKKLVYSLSFLSFLSLSMNAQTVKKVILEDFTGTWCGWCPEGTVILEGLLAANPTTFIPIGTHYGDGLEIPDGLAINDGLLVTGYPNGAVDRFKFTGAAKIPMSRSLWSNSFNTRKALTAPVSVSFQNASVSGTTYSAKVNVKFTTAPTAGVPLKMNVYLLEDSIPATGANAQSNYSNAVQGGADPLTNWFHNATLRKALGGAWGFSTTIPASPVVGTVYSESISFTIPAGWVKKHINVVAFVAYDGTAANNQKEILNADQLPLKYWFPTTVNDLEEENQLALMVSPNPASNNSFIKASFTLTEDANVKMEILNSFGQIVSKPYSSYEIAGSHTIQWNPKEYSAAIAPGMYFVRISSDKGQSSVSKLMIN
jgi:hypothetical protein